MKTAIFGSWKTTAGGIIAILAIVFKYVAGFLGEGMPDFQPEDLGIIGVGLAAILARDNDKKSESVGAK